MNRAKRTGCSLRGGPRGQAGFALVVVFMLLAMMAAAAMAVLLGSRTDIRVGGYDRENAVAFFTAEAGLAYGKGWLIPQWNTATFWTSVLQNPQAIAGITQDYRFGGVQGIPLVRAEYTFRFQNNWDDPSGAANVDQDGRIVLISIGRTYDPAGSRVLATSTLQMELQWSVAQVGSGDYQAQPNQDVTGAARGRMDTAAVDMTAGSTL